MAIDTKPRPGEGRTTVPLRKSSPIKDEGRSVVRGASAIKDESRATATLTPKAPPDDVLMRHGITDDKETVVRKANVIVREYERVRGYRPTAGHVYDVLRANVAEEDIPALYDTLPRTKRHARVRSLPLPSEKAEDMPEIIKRREAPIDPSEKRADIKDIQRRTLETIPLYGDLEPEVIRSAQNFGRMSDTQKRQWLASLEGLPLPTRMRLLRLAGRLPTDPRAGREVIYSKSTIADRAAAGLVLNAPGQIITSVALGLPYLGYTEGKAVVESVKQRSFKPLAKTNVELAKSVVKGVKEDFTNPVDNFGYLVLDLFGLVSFGASTAARVSAATTGGLRAGIRGPAPRTRTIRVGDLDVDVPLSENPLVAGIQSRPRRSREQAPDINPRDIFAPTPGPLKGFRGRFFSEEARAGRQLESNKRIELAIMNMTRKELERVTGWASRYTVVRDFLPKKARKGLSRGEQMALLIESLDEPGDFAARAQVLRDFHTRQIELGIGDALAHEQKIRDISLAERAVEKPSPRFKEALTLTRQSVAEMEALKREFGLTDDIMAARVVNLGRTLRGEAFSKESALSELYWLRENLKNGDGDPGALVTRIEEVKSQLGKLPENENTALLRDESFYFPLQLDAKGRFLPKNLFRGVRRGQFGVAARDISADLGFKYRFDGKSLHLGDYRIDTSRLVGDALGKTIRGALLVREYQRLLKASHPERRTRWDVPIRTPGNKKVPDKLREILGRDGTGDITANEAAILSKQDWEATIKELYGATYNDKTKRWELDTVAEGGEFRWVDSRLMGQDSANAPGASVVQKVGQYLNTPFRTSILYLRPAYITNLVGSAGMQLVWQGPLAGPNVVRALFAKKLYGPRTTEMMRELVGAGKTSSFVDEALTSRVERFAATKWNRVTDMDFRVSALIYQLRKSGYRKPDAVNALFEAARKGDEKALKVVQQTAQRAKKQSVEYDNLSWFEREYLKHYIFIYPWLRGAAVWNVRTILERPVTSAVLSQFGEEADDYLDDKLGAAADWFKKTGFFPIAWDGENPIAINTQGVNTLSTLAGLFADTDGPNVYRNLLGPMSEIAVGAITGRDQFGREYERAGTFGNLWSAVLEVTLSLPQSAAYERAKKAGEEPPLPDIDLADRDTLITRRNAALRQLAIQPGWSLNLAGLMDIPGTLITGGPTPRKVNKLAILARAYLDLPREEQIEANRDLILTALKMQGEALKRPVPASIKEAVNKTFDLETAVAQAERDNGGVISETGRLQATVDWLVANGYDVNPDAVMRKAKKLEPDELQGYRNDVVAQAIDPRGELRRWDEEIGWLAKASDPASVDIRLQRLASDGVSDTGLRSVGTLKTDDLREYGRKVAEYRRKASELEAIANDETLTAAERAQAERDRAVLEEQFDKPIMVKGKRLPSPVRFEWADLEDEQRAEALATYARQSWESLSPLEKELLGRKPASGDATAWALYEKTLEDYVNAQPPGERRKPYWLIEQAAKYVDKQHTGFFKDWLFAQQPLARRLELLKPIQQSPAAAAWRAVLLTANKAVQQIKAGYPSGLMKDQWRDYVSSTLLPWAKSQPGFDRELALYGQDILFELLD